MPLGSFGYGCIECAYQIRSIGAQLYPAGDTTNMVNWVNSYDITTVPWSTYHQGNFTDPAQTTPPGFSDASCASGLCSPQNMILCVGGEDGEGNCNPGIPCPVQIVQRTQYVIPFPMAYFVIAYGTSISAAPLDVRDCGEGGDWFSLGCIYPAQPLSSYPLIVDLPIPDNTLDETILVQNYYLGIIQPGSTYRYVLSAELSFEPDLGFTESQAGVAGFGASWAGSISTPCYGPTDDPFTGSDPP